MNIALVWYFDKASSVFNNWRDGVRGAMDELENRGHRVTWYLDKKRPPDTYDFILLWDDSNSEFFKYTKDYSCPIGVLLTTNPTNATNLMSVQAVYCESDVVYNEARRQGIRAIKAFGTDTDFYKPDESIKKDVEYFYPATFSPWKRQSEIAYLGDRLFCVGTVQPDGYHEYMRCQEQGVVIEEGYFPAEYIRDAYRRSENVVIPAVHGSERTVLEAMSMNILPEVIHKNQNSKAYTYIQEHKNSGCNTPREFIIKNYSHKIYADQILKGYEK